MAADGPVWTPSSERVAAAAMTRFRREAAARTGLDLTDGEALHAWSVADAPGFWEAVWDFCGLIGDKGARPITGDGTMRGTAFFPDAHLNFAENLLRAHPGAPGSDAIVFQTEGAAVRRLSWAELEALVSRMQQALAAHGIKAGDRVAAMLPNMPEAIAFMLAAASIGAVWTSCSPDFGVRGVLDRFGQIEPKLFVACDGYRYGGKRIAIADKLAAIVPDLPSAATVVIVPLLGTAEAVAADLPRAVTLDAFLALHAPAPLAFARLPFAHPLFILFSSGTTGVPKCIVHAAGGTLLQLVKEHRLHCDVREGDRVFYFTTLGWMMWNWLAAALASGATLLLYDGNPAWPETRALWDYAEAERATLFGTSAKYIDAMKKAALRPRDSHDLATLRTITSTGSPLAPESFDYVYDAIKPDVHLASISGGTDIVSCFVLGDPTRPVWRGEIQGPGLGMAVDVWSEDGVPVREEKGELVCTRPFPSMPVMFWNDPDGAKYHAAYFDRFPGIWCHGDFAEWTAHGGIVIHGRSDATLKPGGVRIGTAEIYAQVEQIPAVLESLAIGQEFDGDVRIVLFVRLAPGASLDEALAADIRTRIRTGASPRHVPARILAVTDIPRTKSGKITELAVREIVHGRPVKNVEALANPEALDLYRDLPELRR